MNLYVHVPYCVSKCNYCAFYSVPADDSISSYPALVGREIELRGFACAAPHTVYIGGGTPSLLGERGIRDLFSVLPSPAPGSEISLEVNPGDVTSSLADAIAASGVNRVSIGAQSFDDACLGFLGRRHRAAAVFVAVSALRHAGIDNIGLDLIAAVPGFGADSLRRSVEAALELGPKHVSVYSLSVESGTNFARGMSAGTIAPVSDEESLGQLALAESALCHAGFHRYEISNYAVSGYECRHNLAVWRGQDYVGVGPAAASRMGLMRRVNCSCLSSWRGALVAGMLPPAEVEQLSERDDELERFVTGLRLAEGQSVDSATKLGGERLEIFRRLEKVGAVRRLASGAYSLTSRGMEVADAVMAEF